MSFLIIQTTFLMMYLYVKKYAFFSKTVWLFIIAPDLEWNASESLCLIHIFFLSFFFQSLITFH